jgi:hypothetical protein
MWSFWHRGMEFVSRFCLSKAAKRKPARVRKLRSDRMRWLKPYRSVLQKILALRRILTHEIAPRHSAECVLPIVSWLAFHLVLPLSY